MNERLHNILDGNLSEEGDAGLFSLPEEKQEFLEHQKLRESLRQNSEVQTLTSSEKMAMQVSLAAAIGFDNPVPPTAAATTSGTGMAAANAGKSWYLKGFAALLLGIALGAGLFAVMDEEKETTVQTIGIAVESTVPSAVPFGLPSLDGNECDSLVQQLRDSLQIMQKKGRSSSYRSRSYKRPEPPTTGGDPSKYMK